MTRICAIVPARSGSKGVPGKNVKLLAGKPLLAWSIEAALQCPGLDRLIVSTEDPETARIAQSFGAQVPFLRPAHLARDETPGLDPIVHALRWLAREQGYRPDWVLCLQPTSPLRSVDDINRAIALAEGDGVDAVVGVTEARKHPYWMKKVDGEGFVEDFVAQDKQVDRRQELPKAYALNGAIYLCRTRIVLQHNTCFPPATLPLVMPEQRSFDIDTPLDFFLAEQLLSSAYGGIGA